MPQPSFPVIGLVGGIGAGKSSVAEGLRQHFSVLVLDADRSGHRALQDPVIREQLVSLFGTDILSADREIDRKSLARLVFGDSPGHRARRKQLEGIVQPRIRQDLLAQLDEAAARGGIDVVLLDAPVLLESGWETLCDAIAYIDTPREQRVERVRGRGWSAEELDRREASQMPLEEKRRRSDVVLDNSGEPAVAVEQLREFVKTRFRGGGGAQ